MRPRVERLVRPFGAAAAAQKSSRGCDPREQPPATDRVVVSCRDSGRGLPFPVPLSRHQAAARFPGMRPRLLGRIPGYGLVRLSPHPLDPAFCPVVDTHFRGTVLSGTSGLSRQRCRGWSNELCSNVLLSTAARRRVSVGPELVPRQRHRLLAGGATEGSTPGTRRRQRSCAATAAREKRNNPVPLSRHKGKSAAFRGCSPSGRTPG